MNKKKVVLTVIKVASGWHAAAMTVKNVKESGSRIARLWRVFSDANHPPKPDKMGKKFMVYSPFVYQFGEWSKEKNAGGGFDFESVDVVQSLDQIPAGKPYSRGAYFVGDDYAELMKMAFTPEQIDGMVKGFELRKALFLIGGMTTIILSVMFMIFGKWVAVISLPPALAMLSMSIKNGIAADTLTVQKPVDLKDYLARNGFFGWAV